MAPVTSDAYAIYSAYSTCSKDGWISWECGVDTFTTAAAILLVPEDAGAAKNLAKEGAEEIADHLGIVTVEKAAEEGASKSAPDVAVLSDELTNELKDTKVIESVKNPETGKTENVISSDSYPVFDEIIKSNENSEEYINILRELEEKGISEESIAKETQRGLTISEIKKNVDYLLGLGISPNVIENEVKHGISTRETVENVNYLLNRGMSKESIGEVIEEEAKHGLTTRAVREHAEELVDMGITEDNVGRVIEEAEKHGTNLGSLVQRLDMFLESADNLGLVGARINFRVTVHGEVVDAVIVVDKGNEDGGLVHWWLRHVIGYDMENKPVTDFWPMGQKIIANGQEKELPTVINNPEQLAQLLKKTIQEMKKNPEKYFLTTKGNLRKTIDESVPVPTEVAEELNGKIEEVEVMFSYKQLTEPRTGGKVNVYTLESFFPVKGEAVYEYQSWSNNWIQKR
ncbi:hypothetical protein E3E29_11110 [Thermococcus sp. Bubb.Bath]|nr:hypothetical protein [Thermococcus sp. Bubb.Bath]